MKWLRSMLRLPEVQIGLVMLAFIVLTSIAIASCMGEVREEGLKAIVESYWYGENK